MVARVAYLILSWIALAQSMSGDGDIVPLPFNTSCEGARNSYDRFLLEKRLNEAGENVIYKELQSGALDGAEGEDGERERGDLESFLRAWSSIEVPSERTACKDGAYDSLRCTRVYVTIK